MRRMLAWLLAICLLMWSLPALGEGVSTPTDLEPQATEAPTRVPDPTEAPQTPAPTSVPMPAPTPETSADAWDEAACDHMNVHCLRAPVCEDPTCAHIAQDVHGLDVPLCARGRWVIEQQEASGLDTCTVRSLTIDLNRGDAVLWRSGSYRIEGGERRNASLRVADGRTAVLTFRNAACAQVTLGARDDVRFAFNGQTIITKLTAGKDTNVCFSGPGAMVIDEAELSEPSADGEWGLVQVIGGSLNAPIVETDDRVLHVFPANGVTSATVSDAAYPLENADADGNAYLWLKPAKDGRRWESAQQDGVLNVYLVGDAATPDAPTPQPTPAPTRIPEDPNAPDEQPEAPDDDQTASPDEPEPTPTATPQTDFALSENCPQIDATGLRSFTVHGSGTAVTGGILAGGAKQSAVFEDVRLNGALTVHGGALTAQLTGDNALIADGDAIILTDSEAALEVRSGRLTLTQRDLTGVTLRGNVQTVPEAAAQHLCLTVTDRAGEPVADTALTLRVNEKLYHVTTFADGSLHLWGIAPVDGQAVAATDGERVFTAVVMSDHAALIEGLTISGVTCEEQGDTLIVRFACEGAKSAGVMYAVGSMTRELPDNWVSDAKYVAATDGEAVIRGLKPGETVSLRVYAANAEDAALTEMTSDGFQFGELVAHKIRPQYAVDKGALDAPYTGKAYVLPVELPEGFTVTYTGTHLINGKPVQIGSYTAQITVPEDTEWQPGTLEVPFEITKIDLLIWPDPNQEKFVGMDDPPFFWTAEGLLEGDEVTGELTREPGEEIGNYAFLVSSLHAPAYYHLALAPDAPMFTILPSQGGYWPGAYERLHPVKQEITRADGRTLSVVLNAQESLVVTHSVIGEVVHDTETNAVCAFTPSLSWDRETDSVLLRLRVEPEVSEDHGYVTNPDGSLRWSGRSLRLSWLTIRHLKGMGVDGLTFINADMALTVPLDDFLTEDMQREVQSRGGDLHQVRFEFRIMPVQETPAQMRSARPLTDGWTVDVRMMNDRTYSDATGLLPGLTAAIDLEPVAELMASVHLYDAETFPAQLCVTQLTDTVTALPSVGVTPFMPEEAERAPYLTLMYTHRYLLAPISQAGTVWCTRE